MTLDVFELDTVQKTKKTEKNVRELSGSPGKRSLLALLSLLEIFSLLDLTIETMRAKTLTHLRTMILSMINIPNHIDVFELDTAQKTKKLKSM